MHRRILHIDMDAFFAAAEVARNPALAGKPLIVGGARDDVRGVVSTASYEARRYGVHSAMPLAQARRLCPQGIYLRGDHAYYAGLSRRVRAILDTVTPAVQMASIDEAYLDVTGSQKLFGGDDAIAAHIKGAIRGQLGLPCTVAVSSNKLVSKIAAAEAKPDGYRRIAAGEERAFLAPLPVRALPGAGPKTCAALEGLGLLTLGQLAAAPLPPLERAFGEPTAQWLHRAAQGIGSDEVAAGRAAKQISRETTFPKDLYDWREIEAALAALLARCMYALRKDGLETRRVTLKVRYADFDTRTFAKTLDESTCVDRTAWEALAELLPKARARRARVRLIGVALGLLAAHRHQLRLFDGERDAKWEQVLGSVDALRSRFGFDAVASARPRR